MFQISSKLLLLTFWLLMFHHVSTGQEIPLESPVQKFSSPDSSYPTLTSTAGNSLAPGLIHHRQNYGRSITQYEAAELWRGYCNADNSMAPLTLTRHRCSRFRCGDRRPFAKRSAERMMKCDNLENGFPLPVISNAN